MEPPAGGVKGMGTPMKQPYDWNRRPLGAPLPRRNVRKTAMPRRKEEALPERTGVRIIVGCVVAALLIPIGVMLALRAGRQESVTRRPDSWDWQAAEADRLTEVVEPVIEAPPPVPPPATSRPAVAVLPPPEPSPPAKEAPARVAAVTKKAPKAPKKIQEPEPPAAPPGENRLCTLELSGTLGGAELDPEDAQTWARLSYFLRSEARRPHLLVYPDGSIPVSTPAAADGDSAPTGDDELSAEGEPAYRLVVSASAQKGAGVTFYGQRLSDTYRASVSCRIEKMGEGDTWRVIKSVTATESMNTKDSGAGALTILRRVYDACLEKLVKQLAGEPPFAAALTSTRSR
jgi:hypothetical protein